MAHLVFKDGVLLLLGEGGEFVVGVDVGLEGDDREGPAGLFSPGAGTPKAQRPHCRAQNCQHSSCQNRRLHLRRKATSRTACGIERAKGPTTLRRKAFARIADRTEGRETRQREDRAAAPTTGEESGKQAEEGEVGGPDPEGAAEGADVLIELCERESAGEGVAKD